MAVHRAFVALLATVALVDGTIAGSAVTANQSKVNPTVVYSDRSAANHRSAKEIEQKNNMLGLDVTSELKTTGHKWSPEDYHTLSSLTANDQSVSDDSGSKISDVYPALTTDSPPFVVRSRFVRNPYLYGRGEQQDLEVIGDQRPEFSKWTRYYAGGHRQLKKYGPVMLESGPVDGPGDADVGGTYAGYGAYDNTVDYTNSGYDADAYRNPNGAEGTVGWYGELGASHSSRPVAVAAVAEPHQPASKIAVDVHKIGLFALIKIGLAKLKALAVLKFLALLAVKLKLLALFKLFAFAKFFVFRKILKFFLLPFLPGLLTQLVNALMMQMQPVTNASASTSASAAGGTLRNDSALDSVHKRSTSLDSPDAPSQGLFQFVDRVQSARCVERTACRAAGSKTPGFDTIWTNWIISSIESYIPNRKLKLYISTYRDVSEFRLENIFSRPSTEEWLKWCEERFACEEEITSPDLSN